MPPQEIAMHAIADFLRGFPPFATASEEALSHTTEQTEIEFHAAGTYVLRAGAGQSHHAYVIRAGSAELIDRGRVVDVLVIGDVFGLPSMLTSLPPGLDVRAAEDLLLYRIGEDAMTRLLAERSGLRFLGDAVRRRALFARHEYPAQFPAPTLRQLAKSTVTVTMADSIRDTVWRMRDAGSSCAIVLGPDGVYGIITDNDLRNRVLAPELDMNLPVSVAATMPARTVPGDADSEHGATVALAHAIRHLVVVDAAGELLGVVEEVDLLAAEIHAPLTLRRDIGRAKTIDQLVRLCSSLIPELVRANASGLSAERVIETHSLLVTSVVGRVLALRVAELGRPPTAFSLLVTGSLARREFMPSSDLDTLMVWKDDAEPDSTRMWMRALASGVLEDLQRCGFRLDTNGLRADDLRFSRSVAEWTQAISEWEADPVQGQADIYLTALADALPVESDDAWQPVSHALQDAFGRPTVRAVMRRGALAQRPPTGFMRDLVIEASGEHRGRLDIKRGGTAPIVDLVRFWAISAGVRVICTRRRLESLSSEWISVDDLEELMDAQLIISAVRLQHQVAMLGAGNSADDFVAPAELPAMARRNLRDALRIVARLQRGAEPPGRLW